MSKKINIIEGAMKYKQIVLAFVIAMMVLGGFALKNMPRREYPEFTIRQGVIVGVYPGASSEEVEEQLTKDVENYIFGYEEVDKSKTHSISKEGMMILYVELNDNVHDSDRFWSKLRHGLGELKTELPTSVLALRAVTDFGDTSALLITMSSDEKSYRELEEEMKKLEADVRKISSVSKIKRDGTQDEKIYVYIQKEKMNEYHIDPTTIFASFLVQESLNYSGNLDDGNLILPVHIPPRFSSEEDLMNQVVYSDPQGNIVRLKDIGRIERKYDDPESFIRNNGNNSLLLSLEMQKGNNIVQFGEEVQEVIDNFKANADDDLEINVISNLPQVVDNSISHFLLEFIIAIIAVIIVTMLLLPLRVASVAGVTIPISVLITLGIMELVGIQLHIVSLAGLIVVLGMVVDNAIVVIDNHVEKLDHGGKVWDSAWKAATELFIPVLSATAAIIAAFMPMMLFLKGTAGDFVGTFPVTIAIALFISMIVAILLVPLMCFMFIKKGLHKPVDEENDNKKGFLDKVQSTYDSLLEWTFRNPKVIVSAGVLSVVVGILIFVTIKQQFFPAMERSQFPVEIYLPEGTSLDKTEAVVDSLEKILSEDERVTNVAGFVGMSSPRFNDLYAPKIASPNFGQLMVNTISEEATIEILDEYSRNYQDAFPEATIKWKQLAMENFEAPLEVRISGDNIKDLKQIAAQVEDILKEENKVSWVRNDWGEMRRGINVAIDRNKASQLGYAKTLVAASLMTSLDGMPLTTIWEGDYPVSVVLAEDDRFNDSTDDLEDKYVASPKTMESVPLRSIADLEPEWTEGEIAHRNGVRTITVLADIDRGEVASKIFSAIQPKVNNLELPEGVDIEYGGDYELTIENIIPMMWSLATSVLIIFFILLLQFKTSRRALLIMSTMPMSFLGAAIGLKLTGYPFGMTSFIGIIGLVGIVVRNGIILIDYAMQLVHTEGYSYKEAAIAAGKRRMRPIFLTSMAAAMGVVPMIISNSPLWGPLGAVICFGMIVGMLLTLLILPVLYWKVSGDGPKRENLQEVE